MVLHRHILLASEAAANQRVLHLYLIRPQRHAAFVQRLVGGLVGGIYEYVPVLIYIGHSALGLEEGMLCPWRFKMPAYHVLCLAYLARRVAAAYMLISAYVVLFLVKHPRRVRCTRLLNIMDGRQHLVFHLDELLCLFEGLPVLGSNQGDSVAQIMHKAAHGYKCVLIVFKMAYLVFPRYILGCQYSRHAGQRPCG